MTEWLVVSVDPEPLVCVRIVDDINERLLCKVTKTVVGVLSELCTVGGYVEEILISADGAGKVEGGGRSATLLVKVTATRMALAMAATTRKADATQQQRLEKGRIECFPLREME